MSPAAAEHQRLCRGMHASSSSYNMHAVHAAAAARDYAKACTCRCCSEGAVLPHSQRPGVMHLGGMRQRARAWVAPPAEALAALVLEGELWAAFALRLGAMKKSMMIKEAKALVTCPETGGAIVFARR